MQRQLISSASRINFARYFSTLSALQKGQTIGFIGLGNMGANMASNLMKNGHNLVVFDVFQPSVDKMKEVGAQSGVSVQQKASPKEVASEVDILITMLPSSPHVAEVYTGKDGVMASFDARKSQNRPKLLALECSTISPPIAKEVASKVNGEFAAMVDAPVSGGVTGAAAATLTFMVGGEASTFEAGKPVLQMMGKNIVHCGQSGTGQAAKVCNNLILAISMAGVAEAYNLGNELGISPNVLASIVNTSSGRCWSSDAYNPVPGVMEGVPSSRDYAGGFGVDLMLKDINLAREAAATVGVPMMMGDMTAMIYDSISKEGNGKKDFGYIYQHYKSNNH